MSRVLYWVGNSGRADDPEHYSLSSGGTGGEAIPTADDWLIIDQNSFTQPGQHIIFPMEIFKALIAPNLMSQTGESALLGVVAEPPITMTPFDLTVGDGFDDPVYVFAPSPETPSMVLAPQCTISCPAEPAVVTLASHGFIDDDPVYFVVNSGQISNEIKTNTIYYVIRINENTFNIKDGNGITMNSTGSQTATRINVYKVVI